MPPKPGDPPNWFMLMLLGGGIGAGALLAIALAQG